MSSTNKTECHDIAEILLNVALNFKCQNLNSIYVLLNYPLSMSCSLNVNSILTWDKAAIVNFRNLNFRWRWTFLINIGTVVHNVRRNLSRNITIQFGLILQSSLCGDILQTDGQQRFTWPSTSVDLNYELFKNNKIR